MQFKIDQLYHIYNQGNNQQPTFKQAEDYLIFLRLIRKLILPNSEIIAYCLMPNHFHLLVYTDERIEKEIKQGGLIIDPLTNGIRKLLSGYARIFNKQYHQTGSLFRQKTKYKCLSQFESEPHSALSITEYCFNCFQYIHLNPLATGIVKDIKDWEYSSYKDYIRLRNGTLCNKELAKKYCGYNENEYIAIASIDDTVVKYSSNLD